MTPDGLVRRRAWRKDSPRCDKSGKPLVDPSPQEFDLMLAELYRSNYTCPFHWPTHQVNLASLRHVLASHAVHPQNPPQSHSCVPRENTPITLCYRKPQPCYGLPRKAPRSRETLNHMLRSREPHPITLCAALLPLPPRRVPTVTSDVFRTNPVRQWTRTNQETVCTRLTAQAVSKALLRGVRFPIQDAHARILGDKTSKRVSNLRQKIFKGVRTWPAAEMPLTVDQIEKLPELLVFVAKSFGVTAQVKVITQLQFAHPVAVLQAGSSWRSIHLGHVLTVLNYWVRRDEPVRVCSCPHSFHCLFRSVLLFDHSIPFIPLVPFFDPSLVSGCDSSFPLASSFCQTIYHFPLAKSPAKHHFLLAKSQRIPHKSLDPSVKTPSFPPAKLISSC